MPEHRGPSVAEDRPLQRLSARAGRYPSRIASDSGDVKPPVFTATCTATRGRSRYARSDERVPAYRTRILDDR